MMLGVPKEIKNHEYRIGLTPASVRELAEHGHRVIVQTGGGNAIGFSDDQYISAGAFIADTSEEIFTKAEMVIKVKEPQPGECEMLRPGQILFAYLHLAPDPKQAKRLIQSGATCIAYETVTDTNGRLPLLAPMSQVAGRLSIQAAAHYLENAQGGSGVLLGGVPGVPPGKVLILGGGVVGANAAKIAVGMGAEVTILDTSLGSLRKLDNIFKSRIKAVYCTLETIAHFSAHTDVIIGSVLIPGAAAPKLIYRKHLKAMRKGSVIVDVAIDQGGCFETSRPTTHDDPTYVVENVTHYCVSNMPGNVARTSTVALNNATIPYILNIANKGVKSALLDNRHFLNGLNIHAGKVTHPSVAEELGYEYVDAESALKNTA